MKEVLQKLTNNQQFISAYINLENSYEFVFGKIIMVDERYLAIYMISPQCKYDGILVVRIDNVYRVEIDDKYIKQMQKAIDNSELHIFNNHIEIDRVVESILDIAKKEKKIITIELLNSGTNDVIGIVKNLKNNICEIKQIDECGKEDGYSYIKLDQISQLVYDSCDEHHIQKLYSKQ